MGGLNPDDVEQWSNDMVSEAIALMREEQEEQEPAGRGAGGRRRAPKRLHGPGGTAPQEPSIQITLPPGGL